MLGAVGVGYIAQFTNLGVPFVLRAAVLGVMFVVARCSSCTTIGFTPKRGEGGLAYVQDHHRPIDRYGWKVPAVST